MTQYINNYYFSLVYTTLLVFFSLPLTHIYTQNVLLYGLMTFVILLSTVVVEMTLNPNTRFKSESETDVMDDCTN
ncbi:hypothetical protein [Staphylococcus pseudintermedius]|uniref:hypothetical protein n=1 Tax=Staphylococcus pseudintermedius TaxID=283734 RepID=UPI002884C179|nr:hypothetical protein [Staphylococcus pseudintermedius]MDT0967621.1 hypothetical protein [Staphylococcus pseudintermedius]